MSQPAAGTATASTITVSTPDGLTVTVNLTAPSPSPRRSPRRLTPPPGASTTIFFDDFTGAAGSLPNSANWNVINTTAGPQNPEAFGGGDQEQYLANPALIAQDGNSNLVFTVGAAGQSRCDRGILARAEGGHVPAPGQFYNGVFATHGNPPKVAVLPGQSCEFSAKTMPLAGLWPSLWFMCPGATGGAYPSDYYEFDLMESGLNGIPANTQSTAWGPGAAAQQNLSTKVGTPRTPFNLGDGNYHTYRLDYFTDHLSAYIDGVLQYTITQAQVNAAFGPQAGINGQFGGQEWPYDQPE